jgi:glutaredoxin
MPEIVITLYSRQHCHLCEQAKQSILELQNQYSFRLEEMDIDQSEALTELYGLMVPVIQIDGKMEAYGQINKFSISNRLQEKLNSL